MFEIVGRGTLLRSTYPHRTEAGQRHLG